MGFNQIDFDDRLVLRHDTGSGRFSIEADVAAWIKQLAVLRK